MKTRKQIEVTKKTRAEIRAAFKCSEMAVWRALSYVNDTDLSLRIRKLAMEKGGVLLCITPAVETIHDSEGFMRQYFPHAVVEVNKQTGTLHVYDREGNMVSHHCNATIAELCAAQERAKRL